MEAARASTSIPRDEPSSSDLLRSTDGRSSTPNGMPRPHHSRRAFGNDDDEDDDASGSHHRQRARHNKEHLTGYSHRGAERRDPAEPKRTPRVIPLSGAGSDWREERKRRLGLGKAGEVAGQRSSLPGGTHASSSSIGTNADRINDGEQRIGLQRPVRKEAAASVSNAEGKGDTNDHSDRTPPADATVGASTPSPGTAEQAHMLTDDERARKALLAGQFGSSSGFDSGRVIPLQQNAQLSEEDAFRQDAATRPDAPTLDDYAATPVEEFGKALLRGMGWQEGMGAGKGGKGPTAPTEVKKRSALLGLGASERPSAFGSGAGGPKPSNSNGHRSAKQTSNRSDVRMPYRPLIQREPESRSGALSSPSSSHRSHRTRSRSPSPRGASSRPDSSTRRDDRERSREHRHRHRPEDARHADSRHASSRSGSTRDERDRERDRDYDRHRHRPHEDHERTRESYPSDRHRDQQRGDRRGGRTDKDADRSGHHRERR